MKLSVLRKMVLLLIMVCTITAQAFAQRQMEQLNRGLVAVRSGAGYFLSWRLLGMESRDTAFNVYKGAVKLNSAPLTSGTCYQDNSGGSGTYTVKAVVNGQEQGVSEGARVLGGNYLSIPIQPPVGGTTPDNVAYTYGAGDASVGDLDGDGEYEIVLKWEPSVSKDNSQGGYTGNVYLDGIELDGTRKWRIDLGRNIRSGGHYTQFMVYDLDGDGKAEVACKTADGTKDGQGIVIGNGSADHRNSSGWILAGPEFLTVFSGQDGKALNTVDYIPGRGNVCDWGDCYGNRVDRFLATIAYLDGVHPSLVMCRGYYTRTVLAAWDFRNGKLVQRWVFDSNNSGNGTYAGQGNHNLSVADVDQDGKDEIIYGACAIDDNGKGLWTTGLGHGDAAHVSDIDPSRPGLEKWGIHEGTGSPGSALLDARTGQILWKTANADAGRGVAADLVASSAGMEVWGGTDGLYSAKNIKLGSTPVSSNFVIWWDGDLLRELLDGTKIDKYGVGRLLTADGCSSINGTKANPCLQVDIWGDWREEVIWKTSDNKNLRIYTTTVPTDYRLYTLMHDSVYRLGIAWQNVAYNQPPHTSYFLGAGMKTPPQPDIYYPNPNVTPIPGSPTPVPTPTPTLPPPPEGSNVALNKAVSSSSEQTGNISSNGNDGDLSTRWCASGKALPQWWQVDLGSSYKLTGSIITWEFSDTYYYTIAVSADNSNWQTVVNKAAGNPSSDKKQTDYFSASNIRYVRITINGIPSGNWASFSEFELFSSSAPSGLKGDVNRDGVINIVDALMTAQYYVGAVIAGYDASVGDVNCDGSITIIDALITAQYYVNLISRFPC